jgi:hypothetical protein
VGDAAHRIGVVAQKGAHARFVRNPGLRHVHHALLAERRGVRAGDRARGERRLLAFDGFLEVFRRLLAAAERENVGTGGMFQKGRQKGLAGRMAALEIVARDAITVGMIE